LLTTLQHSQKLEPHIIRQVNQQRAKLGYQPFKTSQKVFTEQKKKVKTSKRTKNGQKESQLEHVNLSMDRLPEGAPTKKETKKVSSGQKQIKEKDMAGIYHNLIVSTIAKLHASFKSLLDPTCLFV
jgi:hypothetical protein